MNARNSRRAGTSVEELNDAGATTETQDAAAENAETNADAPVAEGGEGGAVKAEGEAEKRTRNTIDTTGVTVGDAIEIDDFGKRSTKLDTDPVAVAVNKAEIGKVVPLMVPTVEGNVDTKKVAGVKALARRAATRRGVGINFDDRKITEGVVLFKVNAEKRATKPKKNADAPAEGTNASE